MSGKVLILNSLGASYGAYFLERGFVKLLGAERVRSWPYKHTHNGGRDHYPERCWNQEGRAPGKPGDVIHVTPEGRIGYVRSFTGCELWAHRALWRSWKPETFPGAYVPNDGPVHFMEPLGIPEASDDEILLMMECGEFSLVVLNDVRWHGSAAAHELRARFGNKFPLAFCDHDDYTQLRWDFTDAFQPDVYFKRSSLTTGHPCTFMFGNRPLVPVRPMPFSSMWDVPWVPWEKREFDVCCLFGATQWSRGRLLETTKAIVLKTGARGRYSLGHIPYPEYMHVLSQSKIVIDQQSYGTDTVRFWEAMASGAAVISDHCLAHPAPILSPVNGEHFIQYENDLSPAGDKQDFTKYGELLVAALEDDAATEGTARRGYEAVRAHHQNENRARYVISEMRSAGHSLEGLP